MKDSLKVLDDGTLAFYELLETSQTQKNLVYSIWFNKYVSVTVVTKDGRSYQLKGIPGGPSSREEDSSKPMRKFSAPWGRMRTCRPSG